MIKSKKYLLAFVTTVQLFGYGFVWAEAAQDNSSSSIPSQKCDRTIIVDIGNLKFNVPRDDLRYSIVGDERDEAGGNELACTLKEIKNVSYFRTTVAYGRSLIVALIRPKDYANGKPKSTYEHWKDSLGEWTKEGTVTKLPNGTEKIQLKGMEHYLLPADKAPTANGEPIFLFCSGTLKKLYPSDSCTATYIYPDGMGFSYTLLRDKVPEEDYLDFDLHWRQVYEQMKIKSKVSRQKN